jgi:demethylmenaquinone methyltransferase/2-methoxy-6-polyprenyl-1,4-benzoquinol methylase
MSAETTLAVQDGSGAFFDRIAARYDLLNRIISLGVDQRWRRRAVRALELPDDGHALDLATGTADLAIRIARTHPGTTVIGVDPSVGMLDVGRDKVTASGLDERVSLEVGDAQSLPFDDDDFDGTTIAFGIRNVPDRAAALREMARVTRPGGRVVVLELSEPRSGILGPLARFHIHEVVPRLGALLSGAREYHYLQRSIAAFPPPREFAALCEESGLSVREVVPLTFGVACLYVAEPKTSGGVS